ERGCYLHADWHDGVLYLTAHLVNQHWGHFTTDNNVNLIGGNHRQRVHEVVAVHTHRRPLLAVNPVIPVHIQGVLTVGRVSGVVSTYLGANGRGVWVKGDVSTRANGGEFSRSEDHAYEIQS